MEVEARSKGARGGSVRLGDERALGAGEDAGMQGGVGGGGSQARLSWRCLMQLLWPRRQRSAKASVSRTEGFNTRSCRDVGHRHLDKAALTRRRVARAASVLRGREGEGM